MARGRQVTVSVAGVEVDSAWGQERRAGQPPGAAGGRTEPALGLGLWAQLDHQ